MMEPSERLTTLNRNNFIFFKIGLTVSVILGILIRLKGIGNVPLSIDEYYTVKSVENILKYGLPKFDSGGYYVRGIIYQYILAFTSIVSGIKPEISFRFINVLFNLLMFPALYQLGKKVANKHVAYIAIILISFSLWEIEFTRFIRMYVVFQTIFVWYIYFLYRFVVEKNEKSLYWAYMLSFISIFIYEGSVFLVALNFLPFFLVPRQVKKKTVILGAFLLIFAFLFITFDFRHLGVEDYLPPNFSGVNTASIPILLPAVLVLSLFRNPLGMVSFLVLLGFSFYFVYRLWNSQSQETTFKISISILLILSILNLFGLAFILFLVLLILEWLQLKSFTIKHFKIFLVSVFLFLGFWFIYANFTTDWLSFFVTIDSSTVKQSVIKQLQLKNIEELNSSFLSIKKIIFLLFNYPNFFKEIIRPWILGIPVFTILSTLLLSIHISLTILKQTNDRANQINGNNFILVIILLLLTAVAIVKTPYNSTRYSFFLYPVLLLMVVFAIYNIAFKLGKNWKRSSIYFISITLFFVIPSEDFNLKHLLKIDDEAYVFRTSYYPKLAQHYFSKVDVKTPAEIINQNISSEDIVISTNYLQIDYYLTKLDYVYISPKSKELPIQSARKGTMDIWSNAGLIYQDDYLLNLIENIKSTVWIVIASSIEDQENIEKEIANRYRDYVYYTSTDNRVEVYRVPKNSN